MAVAVGVAVLASMYLLWRTRETRPRTAPGAPLVVIFVVAAAASLPFVFNERHGPLGEGIYTNDQGAQLYWTDWLQNGFGPEPKAVQFGYPTGPQAVAATAAEATNAPLLEAFNGLLVAIPVLTALTALAALASLPPRSRVVASSLAGLTYLGASFLAQSAFKETAMALLVLAFAVALTELGREPPHGDRQPHPRRAMLVALILFTIASVLVYSLPGLVWFAIAVPIWLALEVGTGRMRVDIAALRAEARRHRRPIVAVAVAVVAVGALSVAQLSGFVGKVGGVQESVGRLNSPVFPGEALGIWPEGDFQVVRGEVDGAYLAVALGLLAAAIGGLAAVRRRDFGLVAAGAAAVIVYAGSRLFASIYVEAKALAVIAPLIAVAALGALLAPRLPGAALTTARYALGVDRGGGHGRLDLLGASRRARRLRPARRRAREPRRPGPGPHGRLPGGGPVRRLLAARHADAKPRRLRAGGGRGPSEEGLAAGAGDGPRHPGAAPPRRLRLRDHHHGRLPEHPAAELPDGGQDAFLRALAARGGDAPAEGDRQERHAGTRARLHRRTGAPAGRADGSRDGDP